MITEDEKIDNGIKFGNDTAVEFAVMESDTIDNQSALLAIMETAVAVLRSWGWPESLLKEHFDRGIAEGAMIEAEAELKETDSVIH